jgi:hypothetical protein
MKAFVYQSGVIGLGETCPPRAFVFAEGDESALRDMLEATSRLAYDNMTWLMPGIPKATTWQERFDALSEHLRWLRKRKDKGVTISA